MGEVSPEVITKTQKSLGKYVKKPVLTEKLLKKPPFRFLHDILKVLLKENGFLKGLFSEEELNSDLVKEKDAKVAFLTKLIDVVKAVSKSDLKARPSKIVAGLEPTETNILLQTIGKILDKNIDTTEYVKKYKSGDLKNTSNTKKTSNDKKPEQIKNKTDVSKNSVDKEKKGVSNRKKEDTIKDTSNKKEQKTKTRDSSMSRVKKSSSTETPKSSDRKESSKNEENNAKHKSKEKRSKHIVEESQKREKNEEKLVNNNIQKEEESNIQSKLVENNNKNLENNNEEIKIATDEKILLLHRNDDTKLPEKDEPKLPENNEGQQNPETSQMIRKTSAGLIRPKSARPKSGEINRMVSSKMEETETKDVTDRGKVVEMKTTAPPTRPKSSLRPPSVRPSSARPGAPRLRPDSALPINEPVIMGNINVIVENLDPSGGDEEETVVIQNTSELVEEGGPTVEDLLDMSSENKGQLVEQILEQIQEGEEDIIKKKVDIDWEQDGLRGKDATTKEVTQLRNLIQNLTKTANPLGKLMNYLHEDLDAMHSELQMWTNTKRQLYIEIDKQKKINFETAKPLLAKLERLKMEVKKVEEEISISRSNILKNHQRITDLVTKK